MKKTEKIFAGLFIALVIFAGVAISLDSKVSSMTLPPEVRAEYNDLSERYSERDIEKLELKRIILENQAKLELVNREIQLIVEEKQAIEDDYLSLVPIAEARHIGKRDRIDLSLPLVSVQNKQVRLTINDDPEKVKLREFLESKNSPYSDIDIYGYADEQNVTRDSVRMLLGMTGKESQWGIAYACTKAGCNKEDGFNYYNAAGLKACRHSRECLKPSLIPDENGFWLQRFENWDQFWKLYINQMKIGYFEKGCESAACISKYFVGNNRGVIKWGWTNSVNSFKNQIPY